MAKVIHVHLIGKRKDFYFSSVAAVFTKLSADDIGVGVDWLQHALSKGPVINGKAVIRRSELISMPRRTGGQKDS